MAREDDLSPGPTGRFPDGKIHPDDEGELALLLGTDEERGVIIIHFGQPTKWLGLLPEQAIVIADDLINKANSLIELRTEKEKYGPNRL